MLRYRVGRSVGVAGVVAVMAWPSAWADTLESALVQTYVNNPTLNSQRAAVRATDENVPQALAGYRPKVSITATGGQQSVSSVTKVTTTTPSTYSTLSGYNSP